MSDNAQAIGAKLPQQSSATPIPHSRPWITDEDVLAVSDVMRSGMLASGALVQELETKVAERAGLLTCRMHGSGRAALIQALRLVGVSEGDDVLLPSYVCHSVRDAVHAVGGRPILCDIGADWCLNVDDVSARLTPRTRAIVAAHLFGIAADVDALLRLGTPVIEDCAQAFGGKTRDGRAIGSIGSAAIYSLQATKPLTAGAGGIVGSARAAIADRLSANDTGLISNSATHVTDLQAALGLSQLARYDEALARRRDIADAYFRELAGLPVVLPEAVRDRSIFFRFPLRVTQPVQQVISAFDALGVHVRRGVDTLLHRVEGQERWQFPGTEEAFATTVSLPIYPALSSAELNTVIAAAQAIFGDDR